MPLTRRVQVYIDAEASDALDTLTSLYGSQREAIERALLTLVDGRSNWAVKDAISSRMGKPASTGGRTAAQPDEQRKPEIDPHPTTIERIPREVPEYRRGARPLTDEERADWNNDSMLEPEAGMDAAESGSLSGEAKGAKGKKEELPLSLVSDPEERMRRLKDVKPLERGKVLQRLSELAIVSGR